MDNSTTKFAEGDLIAFTVNFLNLGIQERVGLIIRVTDKSLDILDNARNFSEGWYIENYDFDDIMNPRPLPIEEANYTMTRIENEANGMIGAISSALAAMRKQRFRVV